MLENKSTCNIKIIDFGTSCFANNRIMTYIQSRFYRAPEIVLKEEYNESIDMWSLGCIIFELVTGKPLFMVRSKVDLLSKMVELKGNLE